MPGLPLSIQEQDRRLRAVCPQFRLTLNADWIGVWEGTLRPVCQTYRIRLRYFSRRYFPGWDLAESYIQIKVLDPPIGADPRGTGELPQHVYRNDNPPDFPALCVYDPVEDNWSPDEPIVDRIIPWTIKWLFFHEEWVASGVWKGGGRHPELPILPPVETLSEDERAVRDRFQNAEFHRLGRKIGVFAPALVLEAASAADFPPKSWLGFSGLTPAAVESRIISALSQGPRPAMFLPPDLVRKFLPPGPLCAPSHEATRSSQPLPTAPLAA